MKRAFVGSERGKRRVGIDGWARPPVVLAVMVVDMVLVGGLG